MSSNSLGHNYGTQKNKQLIKFSIFSTNTDISGNASSCLEDVLLSPCFSFLYTHTFVIFIVDYGKKIFFATVNYIRENNSSLLLSGVV